MTQKYRCTRYPEMGEMDEPSCSSCYKVKTEEPRATEGKDDCAVGREGCAWCGGSGYRSFLTGTADCSCVAADPAPAPLTKEQRELIAKFAANAVIRHELAFALRKILLFHDYYAENPEKKK